MGRFEQYSDVLLEPSFILRMSNVERRLQLNKSVRGGRILLCRSSRFSFDAVNPNNTTDLVHNPPLLQSQVAYLPAWSLRHYTTVHWCQRRRPNLVRVLAEATCAAKTTCSMTRMSIRSRSVGGGVAVGHSCGQRWSDSTGSYIRKE